MTGIEKKIVNIKVKEVAAMAESLALDIDRGALWEGDTKKRVGEIQARLNEAAEAAQNDR